LQIWNLNFEAKKKKEIFLKKLVRLKRSCTFAAAYRDTAKAGNGKRKKQSKIRS